MLDVIEIVLLVTLICRGSLVIYGSNNRVNSIEEQLKGENTDV